MRGALANVTENAERQERDLTHRCKQAQRNEENLRNDLEVLEKSNATLQAKASELASRVQELQAKGLQYDTLAGERETLKRNLSDAKGSFTSTSSQLKEARADLSTARDELQALRQKCELLSVDKSYLTKELEGTNARVGRLEGDIARAEESARKSKGRAQKALDDLLASKEKMSDEYETRLSSAIDKLRQESRSEMEKESLSPNILFRAFSAKDFTYLLL